MATRNDNRLNQTLVQKPKQPKQIGDYIIGKVLGQGTFGKVRLGTHKLTSQKVAIKFLQKNKISQVADIERVTRQIHILKLIRHSNLVQLYQIIQTPKQLLLIMQYMQNGQLFNYIVKSKRIAQDQAKKIFHQLIYGIQYIHKIGVAHRDLKPENILLDYRKEIKIVDFGLSNTYKPGERLETPCGSPCYAAPEMIQGERYHGLKVDIWSSGVILFAMLNGYLPFEDQDTNVLYKKILTGNYTFHHGVSNQGKDLIQKILNNKTTQRYTIQQIKKHPWMQKYKEKKTHEGIIVGYNKIPVDQQILNQLSTFGKYDLDYVRTCIEANRHNEATVTYYLAMKRYLKSGGVSKCDLGNDQFDRKSIQPNKRRDHTKQFLFDNILTKYSQGGSTEITQDQKRKIRFSKDKQQNKQNMSFLLNMKRPKVKVQIKSKELSKDKLKMVLKQKNHPISNILGSINGLKTTSKLNQSVDRRSQDVIKKVKLGISTGKIQRKGKSNKLDCSMNYCRIPLTKSVQKNSGRKSEHVESLHRLSILQNRVTRKYREQFDQSLISKSKGKLRTQTQRQRSRVNSSINQNASHCPNNYQGFNTTTINNMNTYGGHALMNLSKKYKQHDNSSGFIGQYLMKGKKIEHKKYSTGGGTKLANQPSKMIKPRKL